ncbi:MAG: hypothetical protein HYU60_06500 [Magnetospirillum sp.]|nr:hypothetical protein [Magnetospirillum sp.]
MRPRFPPRHHRCPELERAETQANENGFRDLILSYSETHVFGEADVRHIHRTLFNDVFAWAGERAAADFEGPFFLSWVPQNARQANELLAQFLVCPSPGGRIRALGRRLFGPERGRPARLAMN